MKKIRPHFTCIGHHESNGDIERFHSTLNEHIRLLKNQPEFHTDNIVQIMRYAILGYNNSFHSITKLKPQQILFPGPNVLEDGITLRLDEFENIQHIDKIKALNRIINQRLEEAKNKRNAKINLNRKIPEEPSKVYYKTNRRNKTEPVYAKFEKQDNL